MENIISESKIFKLLEENKNPDLGLAKKIINKAENLKGLNLEEVSVLLNLEDKDLIEEMKNAASKIKDSIYGSRLVLFAPLYASSHCVNDCEYCGFHRRNPSPRKKLNLEEIKKQVEILEDMGHKRILLEFGEDPINNPIDYVTDVIKAVYSVKKGKGAIRRANINIAATSIENYKKLKEIGIGTYQLFQETYHKKTFKKLHKGPKADYNRQITAHNKAFEAGIDDIGVGVLFGLYNYKFEVLGLISHALYLEKQFGVGPHTISVPRFKKAETVDFKSDYSVNDKEFLKLIAILRLAVPYAGLIMSTRETPELRREALKTGITQISAGSKASPGGYGENVKCQPVLNRVETRSGMSNVKENTNLKHKDITQFSLYDNRSLDEVVYDICRMGYFPSFCTACYRVGRTGDKFMEYAKNGKIQDFCQPNAILTFKEYLEDYASEKTKKAGEKVIISETEKIKNDIIKNELNENLIQVGQGIRDIFF